MKDLSLAEQLKLLRDTVNAGLERAGKVWGADAQAWTRQGLAELREAFNPSPESVAQQVPYGAVGQPPPGVVTHDVMEKETYSMDDLKQAGKHTGMEHQHERGLER